jgi:serine/threonine protein kinase
MEKRLSVNDRPRFSSPYHSWTRGDNRTAEQVGNYRLLSLIGSGNFGAVFLAEHVHLGHRRAVKLFDRIGNQEETVRAFLRSARYLSALDHPNIVKLHDFGVLSDVVYLAMDLIEPGVAVDLIYRRMPLNATIELLTQVASALEYSHAAQYRDENGNQHKGVYHGDIKPANILAGNNRAYVTDFMLPNMDEFRRRDHGHPCFPYYDTRFYGTPMYMAPEQLRGIVNQQTDVFAFGVSAYELLTGKYPWETEQDFGGALYYGAKETPVTPVRDYNASVPASISNMVESCVALHPGDRPASFLEIRNTLEEATLRHTTIRTACTASNRAGESYDIALSYAGCDRSVAEALYRKLRNHCRVFFDQDPSQKADLWGADLSTHLHQVYSEQSRYCIVLISREYVERVWTNWERRAILQRMVNSRTGQYILPVQIEAVDVPGLPTTIAMLQLRKEGIDGIVSAALRKVRGAETADTTAAVPRPHAKQSWWRFWA